MAPTTAVATAVTNAWQALTWRGFLASRWPWRALAYLVTAVPVGLAVGGALFVLLLAGGLLTIVLVGVPVLLALAFAGLPVATVERRRLRIIDTGPTGNPHLPAPGRGPRAWVGARLREQATWRELAYAVLLATVAWPVALAAAGAALIVPGMLLSAPVIVGLGGEPFGGRVSGGEAVAALPLGLVALPLAAYLVTLVAAGQGALARALLSPREAELGERVVELTRSRARLVDAFAAERRRIERDLHDGAQQRIVSLSMTLGLARLDLPSGPAADLVAQAHEQAKLALAELRELIHGIHPPVLTDRGLPAAVADVAGRSPVPVDVAVELPRRLPEAVEAAGYFAVSEALANVAKHSGARRALVTGRLEEDRLVLEVRDDGAGGAVASPAGGLAGLADRVAVVNGRLSLFSPPGGPTVLRVEIPCAQTIDRTSDPAS
ncbi:MAG: sensor histidine kinase [Mycobacteriales bacterium]